MQTLEQWLSLATRGLSAPSVARVRAEIGEHYQSALESFGSGPSDHAEHRAVAALGDARAANRQYRRVLLTKFQESRLRSLMAPPTHLDGLPRRNILVIRVVLGLLLLELLGFWATVTFWQARRSGEAIPFAGYALLAATLVLDTVIERTFRAGSIRTGRRIRMLRWSAFAVGLTMALASGVHVSWLVCLPIGYTYAESERAALRRKVPVEQWPARLHN